MRSAKVGKRAEAEAALRDAIDKEPRRFYAYVNLADLLASDPARWERRDAIVAFLEKGLDALKEDRKGRFNLALALAGFERAVGRTAEARSRLAPLLDAAAPPLTRLQRKRVLDLLDAVALDDRARSLEDWPAPAPDVARRLAHEARAAEESGRVDDAIRDLEIAVNLAPSDGESWRALGRLAGGERRRAGAGSRRRRAPQRAGAGAGLGGPARAAGADRAAQTRGCRDDRAFSGARPVGEGACAGSGGGGLDRRR